MREWGNLTHWPYTVNPISAIIAPFVVGLIADRYFSTEKILGVLHIMEAIFMFVAPFSSDYPLLFILLIFGHCLCYMPTLSFSNSITFHHINDQQSEFPVIRVFGTIGWITAGLVVSFVLGIFISEGLKPEQTSLPIYLSSIFSFFFGFIRFYSPSYASKGFRNSHFYKKYCWDRCFKTIGKSFILYFPIVLSSYFNPFGRLF